MNDQACLEWFLSCNISTSKEVLDIFEDIEGAVSVRNSDKRNFVFVPGSREDRVLLCAHADTIWDKHYRGNEYKQKIVLDNGIYKGKFNNCGIGADDRAGCTILYLLKNMEHSLLVLDGEECGQIGANYIRNEYPEIFDVLNQHCYMLEFDRQKALDYKSYDINITDEFRRFISEQTGYADAGRDSKTDIVVLCKKICGANLSIGYYDEHTPEETLNYEQWHHTLTVAREMLKRPQKRYPLEKES